MCDYSMIVIKKDGLREKVMESVEEIKREDSIYLARNIFGEEKKIKGLFYCFDSSKNEIVFLEN